MKTVKLTKIPTGQAIVIIYDDGTKDLISYTTKVAEIDSEGWLSIYGLYSMTTRKHIGAFVSEYADMTYQQAKAIYEDGYKYNIYTGGVRE